MALGLDVLRLMGHSWDKGPAVGKTWMVNHACFVCAGFLGPVFTGQSSDFACEFVRSTCILRVPSPLCLELIERILHLSDAKGDEVNVRRILDATRPTAKRVDILPASVPVPMYS